MLVRFNSGQICGLSVRRFALQGHEKLFILTSVRVLLRGRVYDTPGKHITHAGKLHDV